VQCVQCERLRSVAEAATRTYYACVADLECAYIKHDQEATLLLSERLKRALYQRDAALAELTNHESQAHKKTADRPQLSKQQSA